MSPALSWFDIPPAVGLKKQEKFIFSIVVYIFEHGSKRWEVGKSVKDGLVSAVEGGLIYAVLGVVGVQLRRPSSEV